MQMARPQCDTPLVLGMPLLWGFTLHFDYRESGSCFQESCSSQLGKTASVSSEQGGLKKKKKEEEEEAGGGGGGGWILWHGHRCCWQHGIPAWARRGEIENLSGTSMRSTVVLKMWISWHRNVLIGARIQWCRRRGYSKRSRRNFSSSSSTYNWFSSCGFLWFFGLVSNDEILSVSFILWLFPSNSGGELRIWSNATWKTREFCGSGKWFFFPHLVLRSLFCCHCGSSSSCHIVTGRVICAVNSGLLRKIGEMLRRRRNSWRLFPI